MVEDIFMKTFKPLLVASSLFVLAACGVTPQNAVPDNEPVIDLRNTDTQYAFATYTGVRMLTYYNICTGYCRRQFLDI